MNTWPKGYRLCAEVVADDEPICEVCYNAAVSVEDGE